MLESLRRVWREMDSGLYAPPGPVLQRLDEDRMEFSWQRQRLLLDGRTKTIQRGGKRLAKYDDVKAIGIIERRNDDSTWTVVIRVERASNIRVGTTAIEVDASIAAAHLSKATNKPVCVL